MTNQNQVSISNTGSKIGPVKATHNVIIGDQSKNTTFMLSNQAGVQEKKVADIAACLGMHTMAPQKLKQQSSSLEPINKANIGQENANVPGSNTFYPKL